MLKGHSQFMVTLKSQLKFYGSACMALFIAVKMSHQESKDKPRHSNCRHFCLPFNSHNYCPACRESNKGYDPCVTLEKTCEICSGFSEEQLLKVKKRRRYVRKSKATNMSSDNLDLLADEDVESFSGSHADLEGAAEQLFASPPCPQPLCFEALSLKTPCKTVPPTPGTALQQKIESKLEKSLGSQFNFQLQQQMGSFQASMVEAMKSLRDEIQSIEMSAKEVELDQNSTSASKPGPSTQPDNFPLNTAPNTLHSEHTDEAMELDVYGQKKHSEPKSIWINVNTRFGPNLVNFIVIGIFINKNTYIIPTEAYVTYRSVKDTDNVSRHFFSLNVHT